MDYNKLLQKQQKDIEKTKIKHDNMIKKYSNPENWKMCNYGLTYKYNNYDFKHDKT